LSTLSILSAFAFGYFYFRFLAGESGIWPMIVFLAAFCVVTVIRAIAGRDPWGSVAVILVETLAMTGSFIALESIGTFLLVALVVFIFLLWGYVESRDEVEKSLELRFFTIAHPYINKIITAAVLMTAIFYLPVFSAKNSLLTETSFESFFNASAGLIKLVYPGFNADSTVGGVATTLAVSQVGKDPNFVGMPESVQQSVIQQSVSSTVSNINSSLNVHVAADERVETALYDFLTSTLRGWKDNFGVWFFVGWAALIFLLVRSIGFFLSLIVSFVAFLVFYALVSLKVVRIEYEPRMKERAKL
jgi:hypothetical protein